MRSICFLILCLSICHLGHSEEPKSEPDLTGYWEGAMMPKSIPIRFSFHFKKSAEGKWTATLDSLDEGLKNLPVTTISFEDRKLSFEVPIAKATYSGKLNAEYTRISGTWKGRSELTLNLKRVDKPTVLLRPQVPTKPYPYVEEELLVENAAAKLKLAGTLTKPKGAGPFPVAVLISGSGPQDRDETLLGHKPFLVLADHLTNSGIAVFRFDDRGVGKSTGKFDLATTNDFVSDVEAIVAHLKTRSDLIPNKIGLIGHSEGGVVAPMVAVASKEIAFIVLLAGTGVPGDELLMMQNRALLSKMGVPEAMTERSVKFNRTIFELIKNDASKEKLNEAGAEYWKGLTLLERTLGGAKAEEQIKAAIEQLESPWFRCFIKLDPRVALRKVTCPVLAINGEFDLQVPPKENLSAIETALKEAKNADVTTKEFAKLNHLFQTSKTGLPAEYGTIEETIAPEVLGLVGNWISKRTLKE